MANNELYIIGAGGHGAVIKEIFDLVGVNVKFFLDKDDALNEIMGLKVYHDEASILQNELKCFIGIGNNSIRRLISFEKDREYLNAIHPCSCLSPSMNIGIGNVVMAGACINARSVIGNHCIINTNCTVEHDCVISDFAHISPGAVLGGNVFVGEGAHVGVGASIKQGIKIGKWSVIGAGAAVVEDVPEGVIVVGVPAKFLKTVNFQYD